MKTEDRETTNPEAVFSVIIADSHEMMREGIAWRIEKECKVNVICGTSNGYETHREVRNHKPDLLILDLGITRANGSEVLERVRRDAPDTMVIVTTSEPTFTNAAFSLSKGAAAFIPKQVSSDEFVCAVNAVRNGFSYVPRSILSEFINSRKNLSRVGNIFGLSPRELEVLQATAHGLSTKQVAADLDISVRTVETHRHNIYSKTNCRNQEDLVTIAKCL